MYLKHSNAPDAMRPAETPVHYDTAFDVWSNGKGGAFLLLSDGTRQDHPSSEAARLTALESLKPKVVPASPETK